MSWVPIAEALAVPGQKRREGKFKIAIYALVDPLDSGIRYVGVTSSTLTARLERHLKKPTNPRMRQWFLELARVRLQPEIVKLEWVSWDEWEDAERGWIHWCRERGQLLNVDRGGRARTTSGRLRQFTPGKYQEPAQHLPHRHPDTKLSQNDLACPRGAADQVSGRECRPRLEPVAVGVFRRAR